MRWAFSMTAFLISNLTKGMNVCFICTHSLPLALTLKNYATPYLNSTLPKVLVVI